MDEQASSKGDPRWGKKGRDRKADAILATLKEHCRDDLKHCLWLDVGCGSGGVAATLAAHVDQVVGVDPEPWENWRTLSDERLNLVFHAGSYRDLSRLLATGSVDVIVCNQVYEHVDDPAALLHAMKQVMKPGSICYFAGPNLLWPIEPHVFWPFVHWLPRTFAQHLMRRLGSRQAGDLDARSWSYWRLTQLFHREGFQYVSAIHARVLAGAKATDAPRLLRLAARLPRGLFKALAPISPGFVFVLTRPAD